jgi:predicted nuclease of predicted toxin-antitoxin system
MLISQFTFLTDENMPFRVVEWLKIKGLDVFDIKEQSLSSSPDTTVMKIAEEQRRIIITQDSDLATILFKNQLQNAGVIFLRPGHVKSETIIETLDYLFKTEIEVNIPFILVADNQGDIIKVRVRTFL